MVEGRLSPQCSFNSMKVRLKPKGSDGKFYFHEFQFHEGPIKTVIVCAISDQGGQFQFHEGPIKTPHIFVFRGLMLRFNSMKVRLKRS